MREESVGGEKEKYEKQIRMSTFLSEAKTKAFPFLPQSSNNAPTNTKGPRDGSKN